MFVANEQGGSVAELNTSTGELVNNLASPHHRFSGGPSSMVLDGPNFWVADGDGYLTEVNASTGALVKAFSTPAYLTGESGTGTESMVLSGNNLFVSYANASSLNEFRI